MTLCLFACGQLLSRRVLTVVFGKLFKLERISDCMAKKRSSVIPTILIIYGVLGAIVSLAALAVVWQAPTDKAVPDVQDEFLVASRMLLEASDATANVAVTASEASGALVSGSQASRQAAMAFRDVSEVAGFEVLGVRPFAKAQEHFSVGASSIDEFSDRVDDTADSLVQNSKDLRVISKDLRETGRMLDSAHKKFAMIEPVSKAQALTSYLLGYFVVMHVMFALIGVSLRE